VVRQPVAVAVEADAFVFQHYKSGVLSQDSCGNRVDHAVLVVGYGVTENGIAYWLVKNSWGARWGEAGYLRIQRGVPKEGECGIKTEPSYPIVQGKPGQSKAEFVV